MVRGACDAINRFIQLMLGTTSDFFHHVQNFTRGLGKLLKHAPFFV